MSRISDTGMGHGRQVGWLRRWTRESFEVHAERHIGGVRVEVALASHEAWRVDENFVHALDQSYLRRVQRHIVVRKGVVVVDVVAHSVPLRIVQELSELRAPEIRNDSRASTRGQNLACAGDTKPSQGTRDWRIPIQVRQPELRRVHRKTGENFGNGWLSPLVPRSLGNPTPIMRGIHPDDVKGLGQAADHMLSLIHISEPTRQAEISYAVFCLKKKKKKK